MARALINLSYAQGVPILVTDTLRSEDEQNRLYAQGRTTPGRIVTNAKFGQSYHNYGLAFDFVVIKDGKAIWDPKVNVNRNDMWDYVEVGLMGESLGLEWGGRWKFLDLPHFQYTFGLTLKDLRSGTVPPTGTA